MKDGKLKLSKSTERKMKDYSEICEVGAVVEMYWTDDDLTDTEWSAGKNWAEVSFFINNVCVCWGGGGGV